MSSLRRTALVVAVALAAGSARAEGPSAATLGAPAACPARPVLASTASSAQAEGRPPVDPCVRAACCRGAELAPPKPVVRAQAADLPGIAPATDERYNCGVVTRPPSATGRPLLDGLGNLFAGVGPAAGGRALFQSDHCFDNFASPVSNPFLAEDPRALTEARPIFIYQQAPANNPFYRGGDVVFAGLQARLAFTDWLSVVVHKLGYIWDEPHAPPPGFGAHAGFSEVWVGPKVTFLRLEETKTLGALGLNVQIPTGPDRVFQDTGTLSLVPYLSLGQNFLKTTYGSFNALNTFGYSFRLDHERSDYLYDSLHLDFDVGNLQRVWPLVEANYFHYTAAGTLRPINFEGRDLINFGSTGVHDHDEVSIAAGARVKVFDWLQTGLVGEAPVSGNHDLMAWRITFDLIFRY